MGIKSSHAIYKLANGKRVPGATTVINVLNKPALIKWANNLGLQGIDSTQYVDNLADVGTLAHYMVLCYFKGEEPDTSEFTAEQIAMAKNSFASFTEWIKGKTIQPILVEEPLVSETYKFGGTPDLLATIDGEDTLVDFKTGKAIYQEHLIQISAYVMLLREHGYNPTRAMIVRIGRDDDEGFEFKPVKAIDTNWEIFTHCKEIYELQKVVRKEDK